MADGSGRFEDGWKNPHGNPGNLGVNIKSKRKTKRNYMGVSVNGGTPKTSILIGFSIINHPFWGTTIEGNPHII